MRGAGLAIAVVNALALSAWGTFTSAATIPIAMFVGWYMFRFRKGKVTEGSIIDVVLMLAAVFSGKYVAQMSWATALLLDHKTLAIILPAYGLAASILPVWLLLAPRDYLSSYMKIGTIAVVVLGGLVVMPSLKMPMSTEYLWGGGPIVEGSVWPFVCITVMCGAISGFHSLVGSGTTPKMVSREAHLKFIGCGAMQTEAMVSLMALVAACALEPGDYCAISVSPNAFAKLGISPVHLQQPPALAEEDLAGRTGGAVCMAVGMAQIFTGIPGMKHLTAFRYHFMIMFEALFILTTIDAGSRILRYVSQELLGRVWPKAGRHDWWPGVVGISAITSLAWGRLLYHGDIQTIWPIFGVANQPLGVVALAIRTVVILTEAQRCICALTTALPFLFLTVTSVYAGMVNVTVMTVVMLVLVAIITGETARKVIGLLKAPARAAADSREAA